MQALHDALAKHGHKMADTEKYPASRRVVEKSQWSGGNRDWQIC